MKDTKVIGALIVGVIIGLVVAYLWLGSDVSVRQSESGEESSVDTTSLDNKRTDTSVVLAPETNATFGVNMQLAGDSVQIEDVVMPEDGWVVVHEVVDGIVANALGATRLDPGEYEIVIIELLRPSVPESTYVVTLYSDNDNKVFEINADTPLIDSSGNAIFKEFETASGSAS